MPQPIIRKGARSSSNRIGDEFIKVKNNDEKAWKWDEKDQRPKAKINLKTNEIGEELLMYHELMLVKKSIHGLDVILDDLDADIMTKNDCWFGVL